MSKFDDIDSDEATTTTSTAIQRITEDDKSLRLLPLPGRAADTEEADEYDEMRALFVELAETMRAIRSDPNSLKSPLGGYDVSMIRAITSMVDALRKIMSDINKMKNSDRLTLAILETHTRSMSQNLAIPLGEKIRVTLAHIEDGEIDAARDSLMALVQGDIVDIFREAATQAMTSSREQYRLQ